MTTNQILLDRLKNHASFGSALAEQCFAKLIFDQEDFCVNELKLRAQEIEQITVNFGVDSESRLLGDIVSSIEKLSKSEKLENAEYVSIAYLYIDFEQIVYGLLEKIRQQVLKNSLAGESSFGFDKNSEYIFLPQRTSVDIENLQEDSYLEIQICCSGTVFRFKLTEDEYSFTYPFKGKKVKELVYTSIGLIFERGRTAITIADWHHGAGIKNEKERKPRELFVDSKQKNLFELIYESYDEHEKFYKFREKVRLVKNI